MSQGRQKFSGELKTNRGKQSINELASKHKIHPTLVQCWKKQDNLTVRL